MLKKQHKRQDVLSRRERQVMDILYRRLRATAGEVHQALPDRPSYSAVRATLRVLEDKGHAQHDEEGLRYVFAPVVPREKAKRSALKHLIETFFEGSAEQAMIALLDSSASKLDVSKLDRLSQFIEKAKQSGGAQ